MNSTQILEKIEEFEYIIFDFGGIFVNIDYTKIFSTFSNHSFNIEKDLFFNKKNQIKLFDLFETGKISPADFRNQIREILKKDILDSEIDQIWNSMLGDLPIERYEYLKDLSNRKKVYLFSNINHIHAQYMENYLRDKKNSALSDFYDLFDQVYFSHIIGLRKPNSTAFEYILNDLSIDPRKILFIDDSLQHVEGAKKVKINAIHLERENSFIIE